MNAPIARASLFSKCGRYPRQGLRHCLSHFGADTLENLQARCQLKDAALSVSPSDVFRVRGNGNARQPGLLPRYLFGLPSRAEFIREKAVLDIGAGI